MWRDQLSDIAYSYWLQIAVQARANLGLVQFELLGPSDWVIRGCLSRFTRIMGLR